MKYIILRNFHEIKLKNKLLFSLKLKTGFKEQEEKNYVRNNPYLPPVDLDRYNHNHTREHPLQASQG